MTVTASDTRLRPNRSGDVILRTSGLTKYFGTLGAVKNLNLELRKGEVFGFLGPIGAGKSTTVGMLLAWQIFFPVLALKSS
jgi:ABC-type sugar transport system ATPase subunit